MTTREVVTAYLDRLRQHGDWAPLMADDITFTSFTSPVRQLIGKGGLSASNEALLLDDRLDGTCAI